MSNLVQIENKIPPWHQSTEFLTSCPTLYAEAAIKGQPQPGGMDSARGTQVHHTGAAYVSHCAQERVAADLKAFDELARGAGPMAARILGGIRDSLKVDYEHILATELTMSLDSEFRPTRVAEAIAGTCADSGDEPIVVGTLDALYSFPDLGSMRIDDLKTHPRPFDPSDTLQAKTYALLVFLHFAWVEKITFRLIFVRYKNLVREAQFTRDAIPELVATIGAARERQIKLHRDYEAGHEMAAVAGNHCWYCPLLTNAKCPIGKYNAQMQLTPEQRLNFNLWYAQFSRANNAALRSYVQENGRSVVLKDFNGKAYVFGPEEKQSELYPVFQFNADGMVLRKKATPLLPIIDLLYDYAHDNPEDIDWMKNVTISSTSMKKYLKTNKRSFLDQAIEDTCEKVTKVSLRVSKPLDAVPDEEDDEEEWEESA